MTFKTVGTEGWRERADAVRQFGWSEAAKMYGYNSGESMYASIKASIARGVTPSEIGKNLPSLRKEDYNTERRLQREARSNVTAKASPSRADSPRMRLVTRAINQAQFQESMIGAHSWQDVSRVLGITRYDVDLLRTAYNVTDLPALRPVAHATVIDTDALADAVLARVLVGLDEALDVRVKMAISRALYQAATEINPHSPTSGN